MKLPVLLSLVVVLSTACGGKKSPEGTGPEKEKAAEPAAGETKESAEKVQKKIRTWLSTDIAQKISDMGKTLGKNIGLRLAANPEVMQKVKGLSGDLFKDKEVKPRLKAIEDKATAGFGKKLTLGWKALKAGGIDEFKKKVSADAQRVATDVLTLHLKEDILKDERTAALLKQFTPVLKLQGQLAAMSLQENLSPKVTKQIVGIALRIVAAGESETIADSVDAWLKACESDVDPKIVTLIEDLSALPAVEKATAGLAIEVVGHPRTKKELAALMVRLTEDKAVNQGLVKVYEAAAFEKGDPAIQQALEAVLALDSVDREIFVTLKNLAEAEGAGAIIGKHLATVSDDPKLVALIEDFIISVLETCGDPSQS
jgi:hypothetical protein